MKIKALVDTIDRTSIVREAEWAINQSDQDDIDVLEMVFEDLTNTLVFKRGNDIVIEDFDDNTVRFFGGIIVELFYEPEGLGRLIHVTAQDWKMLLDRSSFSKKYTSQTDKFIIQDAFTEAGLIEIDTSLVTSSRTIDFVQFIGHSLRSMLDTVSQITGLVWWVDAFQKLRYEPEGTTMASFNLSDNPDNALTFPYYDATLVEDLGNYNEVEVRGGVTLSSDITETFAGDGIQKVWILGSDVDAAGNISEPISKEPTRTFIDTIDSSFPDRVVIERNTGTDGSPVYTKQDVSLDLRQGGGFAGNDVLWNPSERRVQWDVAPPNFANESWRITGRRFMPIVVVLPDETAQDDSGRRFRHTINEPAIQTIDMAQDIAFAAIRENRNKERFVCSIQKEGLLTGESLLVTSTKYRLTGRRMRVHNMRLSLLGGTVAEQRVTLGSGSHTLAHLLFSLRRGQARQQLDQESAITQMRSVFKTVIITPTVSIRVPGLSYYVAAVDDTPWYETDLETDITKTVDLSDIFVISEEADWPIAQLFQMTAAEQKKNVVKNWIFADDLNELLEWTQNITATGTTTRDTTQIKFGIASLKLVMTTSGASGQVVERTQSLADVDAAEIWSFALWGFFQAASNSKLVLDIEYTGSAGPVVSTVEITAINSGFVLIKLENETVPASTTAAILKARLESTAASATGTAFVGGCLAIEAASIPTTYPDVARGSATALRADMSRIDR